MTDRITFVFAHSITKSNCTLVTETRDLWMQSQATTACLMCAAQGARAAPLDVNRAGLRASAAGDIYTHSDHFTVNH